MNDEKKLQITDLEEAVDRAEMAISKIEFNKESFRDLAVIGYAIRIIDSASSISILLKRDKIADGKSILRTMLECCVGICSIKRSELHIFDIQYNFCEQMIRTLEQAKQGNPFAASISSKFDVESELIAWKEKKAFVKSKGGAKRPIEQSFNNVGLKNEYEMVYRSLCETAHSTFSGIVEHSFSFDRSTDNFEVVLYRAPDLESADLILDTAINLLETSLQVCAEIFLPLTHPSSAPK